MKQRGGPWTASLHYMNFQWRTYFADRLEGYG